MDFLEIGSELARPRTFPQHTLPLLPLLRSRPGGVHKASVVRSPGSEKLPIAKFQLPILFSIGNRQLKIGNAYISVLRCANIRKSPLISRCRITYAIIAPTKGSSKVCPPSVLGLDTLPRNRSKK